MLPRSMPELIYEKSIQKYVQNLLDYSFEQQS